MHGVGAPFAKEAHASFGFPPASFVPVPSQQDADPDFPTVAFPNPEEQGALDAAFDLDSTLPADIDSIVIANDPDADRFTAAEKKWAIFI